MQRNTKKLKKKKKNREMFLAFFTVLFINAAEIASGLKKVSAGEMVKIGNVFGMILNLETDIVAIVTFGQDNVVKEGDRVERSKSLMSIKVGKEILGRVVNALGEPIDGKGVINTTEIIRVERKGVINTTETIGVERKGVINTTETIGVVRSNLIGKEKRGRGVNALQNKPTVHTLQKRALPCIGFISLSPSNYRTHTYNYIQTRTMKTMCQLGVNVRTSRIFISNAEYTPLKLMTKLVEEVDPAVIRNLPRHAQEVVHVQFVKKALTAPNSEMMAELDALKTIFPNKVTPKTAVIEAFNKDGSNIEEAIKVLGKGNNSGLHFIGEYILGSKVSKDLNGNITIILMDEKGAPSIYSHHTRQTHCDAEIHYLYNGTIIIRGFDMKFGNIKHENISTIKPIVYDEQNNYLAGIYNNPQSVEEFIEKSITTLMRAKALAKSVTVKNSFQKHIDLLQDKYMAFPEKMQHSNAQGLETCGLLEAEKIKGLFNPSLYAVSKGSFVDTGHNILSKYPHGLDTYKDRLELYKQILIENGFGHLIPKLALYKGTAFETIFTDVL